MNGFARADLIAARIWAMTDEVWRAAPDGARAEPVNHAWRRLFGEPMERQTPIMLLPCFLEGRFLSIVLYPRGRVLVEDPLVGRTIRRLPRSQIAARTEIANLADQLASVHPTAAWIQRERPDGYASMVDGRTAAAIDAIHAGELAEAPEPSALQREAEAFFGEQINYLAGLGPRSDDEAASVEEIHHAKVGGSAQEFLVSAAQ